jgi:hypothetical protein
MHGTMNLKRAGEYAVGRKFGLEMVKSEIIWTGRQLTESEFGRSLIADVCCKKEKIASKILHSPNTLMALAKFI